MASTPSASALSAVLRCRGNILSRNPPNKRPAVTLQARSLGLAYGAVRDSTTSERAAGTTASNNQQPASTLTIWNKCFLLRGERRPTTVSRRRGEGSSATVKSSAPLLEEDKSLLTNTNDRGIKNHRRSSHWRRTCTPPEDARSYVTGAAAGAPKNAPVRVARTLQSTTTAPGGRVESSVFAAHIYTIKCLQNTKELLPVLNVSMTLPCSKENGGQMIVPLFILKGWSTLKNTCICLSIFVSEMISFNLGVLSCSPDNAREMDKQGESTMQNDSNVQQVKGQMQPSDPLKVCSDSSPKSKENRPD